MILRAKHIEAAESTEGMFPGCWVSDVSENRRLIDAELERLKVKLVVKQRFEVGNQYATTLAAFNQIRLGRTFYSQPDHEQAGILAHELDHFRRRVKIVKYGLSARYRWIEETIAYRESFRIWDAQGMVVSLKQRNTVIEGILARYRSMYLIFDKQAHAEARRIWMLDWK